MKKILGILALGSTLAWADGPLTINRPITIARPLPAVVVNSTFKPVLIRAAVKPRLLVKENAFGAPNTKLPVGASTVSEGDFKKLHANGRLTLSNAKLDNESMVLERGRHEDNLNMVRTRLANHPILIGRFTRGATQVEPTGKNYFHKIFDNNGKEQIVETMGQEFAMSEIANTLRMVGTKENQSNVYSVLHNYLPKEYFNGRSIKNPTEVGNFEVREIDLQINKLVLDTAVLRQMANILNGIPAGFPASCDKEIGWSPSNVNMGDQTGSKCEHHPDGIFKNVKYPLKWYATCVKNQGKRGSCVSFAATGATESAYAVKYNKWYNLSEEHLYNRAKMTWYPSTYGDGLDTAGIMEDMVTKNYKFPYEAGWDYNPSYSRVKNDASQTYTNSCNGYTGEHCSNTNHQGKHVCTQMLGLTFCGYSEEVAETNIGIKGVSQIWKPENPDFSIAVARLASALRIPMTISIPVTPSFDNAPVSGYAQYVGANEGNRGWHALEVLAVVDNKDIPATAPQGAGGGYFVIKNSWGACWKDAGYIYLPIAWIKDYTGSLTLVNSI
jgi:hypothetical protein